MRVIVLGGAGDMGSRAVRTLAQYREVETVTIADLNGERAQALAAELGGSPRVQVLQVDAGDAGDLQAAIAGHQVAASALGPFYRFEVGACRAALLAGADYVSLCDDHDAAAAVLELDSLAQRLGRRAVTGLGWTPGLSNLLARLGTERLDGPARVRIAWAGASADSRGYAVVLHTMHIFTGRVPSFQGGRAVQVRAGSGRERIRFPDPLGEVTCFHLGHPEPLTLPRYLPGLQECTLKGGLSEPFLNYLAVALARLRLTNSPRKLDVLGRLVKRLLPYLERIGPPGVACSGLRVDVQGLKRKRERHFTFTTAGHMDELTATPLAIGALLLGRGQVERVGVFAPEAPGGIPLASFFAELSRRGVTVHEETR